MATRLAVAFLICSALLSVLGPQVTVASQPPVALFVVGSTPLIPGDQAVQGRLASLGYRVAVRAAASTKSSDADGKAVVLISASASPGDVGAKFVGSAVPVVTWQQEVFPALGMTGTARGIDFGSVSGQSQVAVFKAGHRLAGRLSGRVDVAGQPTSFGWGLPAGDALVIAGLPQSADHATVFGYEDGSEMADRRAPARRVGLFMDEETPAVFNRRGWALFEAAVSWAAATNAPPQVDVGPDREMSSLDSLQLNASIEDDGLPDPPGSVSVRWTEVSGPGPVTFSSEEGVTTTLRATSAGTYVIRATADDGLAQSSDELTVFVRQGFSGSGAGPRSAQPSPDDQSDAPLTKTALFVVGTIPLGNGDAALQTRLQNLGLSVIAETAASTEAGHATGKTVVVISGSTNKDDVNTKFRDVTVPVVVLNRNVFGFMKMTDTGSGDTGTENFQTQVHIATAHPLAAGLSGDRLVVTDQAGRKFDWGKPSNNAAKAVTILNHSTEIASFGYDPGVTMVGMDAPARRVGLFITDNAASVLNDDGGALFDAAINWATLNVAPTVNAGPDQVTLRMDGAVLNGTVTDDGLPDPPHAVTTTWSKVSGPPNGVVMFDNANALSTTAHFSLAGAYVLRLTADDSQLQSSDDLTVTVVETNQAPIVSAGPDKLITLPAMANLTGAVSDDGVPNPPGEVTVTWSKISGPGPVEFGNANAPNTTATFHLMGVYVLQLAATDGAVMVHDELTVTVYAQALLVVGNSILSDGDGVILAGLENAGLIVTTKVVVDISDAQDKALVVLSDSIADPTLTAFQSVGVGVITLKPKLFDDMGMTGDTAADRGSASGQSQITITNLTHPLAAGLHGSVSVVLSPSQLGWGKPGQGAVQVATLLDQSMQAAVFGYELGASMPNFPYAAPGRRVGLFLGDEAAEHANDSSRALLEAAILWAAGSNTPPAVYAGSDQVVNLSSVATLDATVADDTDPNPMTTWSETSGPPGGVMFGNVSAVDTTASFTANGTYVLRLTADDGELSAFDELIVHVDSENQAPLVDAGTNKAIMWPDQAATLLGTATDDGLPAPPTLSALWSRASGPGTVSFGSPAMFETTATFSEPGVYGFQLAVNDGDKIGYDDVAVTASGTALFVVGDVNLSGGDSVWKARLEALNYKVVVLPSDAADMGQAVGKDLVVLSSTAPEADLGDEFQGVSVPVITLNGDLFDDMALATGGGNTDDQNRVTIVNPPHPLAGGQVGTVKVSTGFGRFRYANPNLQTAVVIATFPNDATKEMIFAYEKDAVMVNGKIAKARRVAFGLAANVADTATYAGLALIDAAIRWVTGRNFAPIVDAGLNQTIVLPATATLIGMVRDDGLPPPGPPSVTWSVVSGPSENVNFGNEHALQTTASFPTAGSYALRLTADDGAILSSDLVVILVLPQGTQNSPPQVQAGVDQTVKLPSPVALHGAVSDDGLPNPPGVTSVAWTQVGGTGVTFDDATKAETTAHFPAEGVYVLRLTVNDSQLVASDELTINVLPTRQALLVVGSVPLANGDPEVQSQLESLGFTVTVENAMDVSASDANGKDVVLISSTADAFTLGQKLRDTAKPVVTWNHEGWGPIGMSMTGGVSDTDFGAASGQTQILIVNSGHPLAAGLTGTVTTYTEAGSMCWGVPNANAAKVATLVGIPGQATVFAYEPGVTMPGGLTALGRRIGMFFQPALLNDAGWDFFDAAVEWAASPRVPALFVTNANPPGQGDVPIKARLEGLGFIVTVKKANDVQSGDADGKAIVVISSTVTHTLITNMFKNTVVPVVTWEQNIFKDMAMTGGASGTDYGTDGNKTKVTIVDPAHALAGGLSGDQTVITGAGQTFGWGAPPATASRVANIFNQQSHFAIFGYEYKAAMVNLAAPDRRVGLFMGDNTSASFLDAGWTLFDAAIQWAVGSDADGDGLTIFDEYRLGTDPRNADTNGDGIRDDVEIAAGLSPTNLDMDGDGVLNADERAKGTDPFRADTDGDGVNDGTDCFPLDPTRSQCPPPNPNDHTKPTIILLEPTNAILLP